MRSKFHTFDLAVCLLWILSAFCGRYYWNQITTVFLGISMILRLVISFSLNRREKKIWMPLVAYAVSWAFMSFGIRVYNGIGEIGDYFFHVTGLEYNRYVDWLISGCIWMWIIIMPFLYYFYLLIRRRLVDTGMTKKELFGSLLWNDRRAKYYCAVTMLTFISLNAGVGMHQRFCQTMCFIAPPLVYWLICRYTNIKVEKVWLVLLGAVFFWYGQSLGGIFRVAVLVASFIMIAFACAHLYKSTKSHTLTAVAMVFLGVVLPSFSIGYNQYACINYPRCGYYYLAPYNGILYISNTTNGEFLGLRDRYGLLVEPEYEHIRTGFVSQLGWATSFLLQKDGYSKTYSVYDNKISPSEIDSELQAQLCKIITRYFEEYDKGYADKGEILVTDLQADKTIGHVRVSMHGNPIWQYERAYFLPEDTVEVLANEFLRTDSVGITEYETKNILCYAENIPNDSIAKYKVYVRLALNRTPKEKDLLGIVNEVKTKL